MKKILIFLTNHATLGTTSDANGTYASELTHALSEFLQAGYDYDLVTIHGGAAPMYGVDDTDDVAHRSVIENPTFKSRLSNTLRASEINIEDYAAVFYPGGFGLLSDLAQDESVAKLTASIYEKGGVVGAVCHGPAGLLPITLSDGSSLLADKSVTSFTREEEVAAGTIEKIPFLLEEEITLTAAKYSKMKPWKEHVIQDGHVITGQNPASAHGVGKAMVALLKQ